MEKRFVTLYRRQWPKSSQRKKKCKKAKWLSEKAFRQIAEERREEESNDDTTLMQKVKRNQRAS